MTSSWSIFIQLRNIRFLKCNSLLQINVKNVLKKQQYAEIRESKALVKENDRNDPYVVLSRALSLRGRLTNVAVLHGDTCSVFEYLEPRGKQFEICGGRSATGTSLSPSTSVFTLSSLPFHQWPILTFFLILPLWEGQARAKPGNLQAKERYVAYRGVGERTLDRKCASSFRPLMY